MNRRTRLRLVTGTAAAAAVVLSIVATSGSVQAAQSNGSDFGPGVACTGVHDVDAAVSGHCSGHAYGPLSHFINDMRGQYDAGVVIRPKSSDDLLQAHLGFLITGDAGATRGRGDQAQGFVVDSVKVSVLE